MLCLLLPWDKIQGGFGPRNDEPTFCDARQLEPVRLFAESAKRSEIQVSHARLRGSPMRYRGGSSEPPTPVAPWLVHSALYPMLLLDPPTVRAVRVIVVDRMMLWRMFGRVRVIRKRLGHGHFLSREPVPVGDHLRASCVSWLAAASNAPNFSSCLVLVTATSLSKAQRPTNGIPRGVRASRRR